MKKSKLSRDIDKEVAEMLREDGEIGRYVRIEFPKDFQRILDAAREASKRRIRKQRRKALGMVE